MSEGLTTLLVTMWSELNLIIADLLSLIRQNDRDKCARVDWVAEYMPIHFILRLSLYLKTWCISVEKEVGYITITSMYSLCLLLKAKKWPMQLIAAPMWSDVATARLEMYVGPQCHVSASPHTSSSTVW